ncbi:MAG: hypothetical protein LUE93_15690 [Bacteroides sp.]|nr:hypothetical protein [Bacteroides sp.]
MYRIVAALFFSILFFLPLSGQPGKASVNLSLWPPVATAAVDSNRFTVVNIGLYSRNYELRGVGINVLAHTVETTARGGMFSGLNNLVKGHFHGFQLAGIQNTNGACAHGVTIAGMTNFAIEEASGVQVAGAVNIAGTHFRGVQISPAVNITAASSGGMQLAAIANISAERFQGVQLGAGNYAGTVQGVQLGLINLCGGEVHGVQVGVINHSKDTSTVKLGLVNINPYTRVQMMLYGGNTTTFNTGVRFTNNKLYTILGFGTHYLDMNEDFSGSLFYRAGLIFPIGKNSLSVLTWDISILRTLSRRMPISRNASIHFREGSTWSIRC